MSITLTREKERGLEQMREHTRNLARTVKSQTAVVNDFHNRCTEINSRARVLEGEIETLQVATKAASNDFTAAQQYAGQVSRSLAHVRERLEDASQQELALLERVDEMKTRGLIAQRISGKTESLLDSVAMSVDSENRLIAGIEDRIRELEADIESGQVKSARLSNEKGAIEDMILQGKSSIAAIEIELKKLSSQLSSVEIGLRRRHETLRGIREVVNESVQKQRDYRNENSELAKSIRSGQEELEKQIVELTQRREIQMPDLMSRIAIYEKRINSSSEDICIIEKAIKAVDSEHFSIKSEIQGENEARMKLRREIRLVQTQIDRKREECVQLISERDAANLELKELMKEFKKYSTYLVDRDKQIALTADKNDKSRKDRILAEERLIIARLELENLESELRLKQETETKLSATVAKLSILSENIMRKINDQKRIRDLKAERIKEAQMEQQSSDYSLSLSGRIETTEDDINKTIASCGELEKSLTAIRQRILEHSSSVSERDSHLNFLHNIITVRENQERRLLAKVDNARRNVITKQKELDRLRFDLDNIGTIIVRLTDQRSRLDDDIRNMESKWGNNAHAIRLRELNDNLLADADRLHNEFNSLNEQRVELEKMTQVEITVQKSLIGTSSSDVTAIKKTINQMLAHVRDLNKRKEFAKTNLARLVEKRDIVRLRRQSSSLRRSNGMAGLTSCSTVASLTSVPSVHMLDQAHSQTERRTLQFILDGSRSETAFPIVVHSLEVELAALRAQLALQPKVTCKERILEWIEFNLKLLI